MKKSLLLAPVALIVSLALTACGTTAPATSSSSASSQPASSNSSQPSATAVSQLQAPQLYTTIKADLKLGSDGKIHDAFTTTDFTVVKGVPTKVTVINYDDGAHDIVNSDLGLKVQIPGATKPGVPSKTTFTINASKTGDFHWVCDVPCDGAGNPTKPGSNKGWAMQNDGFMAGTIHVVDQQPAEDDLVMTVLPGTKMGSDNKIHDIYSPANLTIRAGVPTKVTVYNYDDGAHDVSAPALGVNAAIVGSKAEGDPSVTTFTINNPQSGSYRWVCNVTCDGGGNPNKPGSAGGWAMWHDGYMAGIFTVK